MDVLQVGEILPSIRVWVGVVCGWEMCWWGCVGGVCVGGV